MGVGMALRILVAFGGAAAVFVLSGAFAEMVLGFWGWLLFAYLATLLAETALLVGAAAGHTPGGKG